MRVAIDPEKVFPNGTYIISSKGVQLNPKQGEGKKIVEILSRQNKTRDENKKQTHKFEKITNKDIDGDGHIGKPKKTHKWYH